VRASLLPDGRLQEFGALGVNAIPGAHDRFHDGQVLKSDATIAESYYLGTAHGGHLDAAWAFGAPGGPAAYSRAALLEAALRFVIGALETSGQTAPSAAPVPQRSWSQAP
jgi:hypothetical protein